jgi:hypothetical protein
MAVFCIFVRGYIFSFFFALDMMVFASKMMEYFAAVFFLSDHIYNHRIACAIEFLPLLRGVRFASMATRIGKLSKMRFSEVCIYMCVFI